LIPNKHCWPSALLWMNLLWQEFDAPFQRFREGMQTEFLVLAALWCSASRRSDRVPWPFLFLPLVSLGTASGEFLRPAASRLLLSRCLPYLLGSLPECSRSLWEQPPSLLGAPENGAEKGDLKMSYIIYVKWNSFGRGSLANGSDWRFESPPT